MAADREPEQQATRILAIRHGETAWNVATRIQGQLDVPLNQTGRWQAERLAGAVADQGIAAVYASDLQRAFETAQAVARGCGLPVVTDTGLRERAFGSFEGMTYAEIGARWPEMAERWRRRDAAFGAPGGETLQVFFERSIAAASRLAARHPGQTIALVSHGGVMDCLYRAGARVALDAPRSWQLGNAAINRLLYTPQGFTLIGWSDTGHLDGAPRDEAVDAGAPLLMGAASDSPVGSATVGVVDAGVPPPVGAAGAAGAAPTPPGPATTTPRP